MLSLNLHAFPTSLNSSKKSYSKSINGLPLHLNQNLLITFLQSYHRLSTAYPPFDPLLLKSHFSKRPKSQILISGSGIPNNSIHDHQSAFSNKPRSHIPRAAADSAPQNASPDKETGSKPKTLRLAVIFGLWYFQNIIINIYDKKALNSFPFPCRLASFQLLAGYILMFFLWSFNLQPHPKIAKDFVFALLGPALFHTIGHISACVSFSKVAVSFTHVIKSSEPVFNVVFSSFLGDSCPITVWLSILPIVLGCSLAAVTVVSFNPQGMWGALISNVGFVPRNIYSKKSLQNFKEVKGG